MARYSTAWGTRGVFQRRHFELIADLFATWTATGDSLFDVADRQVIAKLAHHTADQLQKTNDRFDRDRFLRACHVDEVAPQTTIDQPTGRKLKVRTRTATG